MHKALIYAPKVIDKLAEIERLFTSMNIIADLTVMRQDDEGGFMIGHEVRKNGLLLQWSLGFSPPVEPPVPEGDTACAIGTVYLSHDNSDKGVILDLSYIPDNDCWLVMHHSEGFEHLSFEEKLLKAVFEEKGIDDDKAFTIIAIMANIFTTPS